MGSSSSKSRVVTSAESHRRSVSRNVFQNNCIINRSSSFNGDTDSDDNDDVTDVDEQITDHRVKETVIEQNRSNLSTSKSKGSKMKRADKRHSETQISEWGESSLSGSVSRSGSGSSRNRSSRFLSRFNFFPGNTSSRSSRSSRAYPESSTSSVISNDDIQSSRSANRSKTRQGCDIFPSCLMPVSPEHRDDDSDSDNSDASSIRELGQYDYNNGIEPNRNRRMEAREPVEQNVRFSRTLSVGRLRDRVLQRPTFPELASFPFQQEHEVASGSDNRETESRSSNENVATPVTSSNYSISAMTNSLYGNHEFEVENLGSRDSSSYANLLEHRSNFLERRRRIRSQVHALQRMGSRFENLSGHERSCILSGQHRTGHCTCRLSNQDAIDGTNARGSISRIVLLAEALFEVMSCFLRMVIFSLQFLGIFYELNLVDLF
ncbi:zinc finger, RING/FYVE/PHD-type [Artemisia annua]|uniref:Zinc finger, RING/FYVE/PHD-type n=1 Tax=Artemisia annua TaxID=35608 RepID=A0A2U1QGK5_ARTAN|nr:zinc finger, RING/FYVE/PHD-type [Artemisia annua]